MQLWQRYGSYLVGGALAIVARHRRGRRLAQLAGEPARRRGAALRRRRAAAARRTSAAEAAEAFRALAADADSGYARAGAAARRRGRGRGRRRRAEALASLDGLSESDEAAPGLSPARRSADPAARVRRARAGRRSTAALEPLAAPSAPWRHSALELEALAQLRAGDIDGARRTLDDAARRPADAGQPQPARRRAHGRARRAARDRRRTAAPEAGADAAPECRRPPRTRSEARARGPAGALLLLAGCGARRVVRRRDRGAAAGRARRGDAARAPADRGPAARRPADPPAAAGGQSGLAAERRQSPSHAMHHLAADDDLALAWRA